MSAPHDELPLVTDQHPLEELLADCRRALRRLLITSCIGLGAALAFGVIVLARVHGVAW